MKKFPTKNQLRAIHTKQSPYGFVNGWDLAKEFSPDKVFISYTPALTGRGYMPPKFTIHHIGYKTDPNGPWYDYGNKTFDVIFRKEEEAALVQAIEWADNRYGKREWVRDPFGNYQDKIVLDKVWVLVKESKEKGIL
jgi:hypothetical protein